MGSANDFQSSKVVGIRYRGFTRDMAGQSIRREQPISEVVPHIFKRPLLHVNPFDPLLTVATFLALGPQIYVDGLVVLDSHKAVGIIGGRHTIEYILYHQKDWLNGTASNIMSHPVCSLDAGRLLNDALDIFNETEFAFVPITIDQNVVTTLSVRDVLRVAVESKLETPIREISSRVIVTSNKASIGSALELMLEEGVRSLIVNDNSIKTVLNDRMILEYFLSYRGRQAISSRGLEGLYGIDISVLNPENVRRVEGETPASVAAVHLLDVNIPCLLLGDDAVVTPWDIVMKGLRGQTA